MDTSYVTRLLDHAKKHFPVFSAPQPNPSLEDLVDCLQTNNAKKTKKLITSCQLHNISDHLLLASFYDHCLILGHKQEALWVRRRFSTEDKVKFLSPIDGIRGNLEGLQEVASRIACTVNTPKRWDLPLPVAYGLLSRDPQTIQWCLASFFKNPDVPLLFVPSASPQANIPNILTHNLIVASDGSRTHALEFFSVVLQETDPSFRQGLLDCVKFLNVDILASNFNMFFMTEFSEVFKNTPKKSQAIKNIQEAVSSLKHQVFPPSFLAEILKTVESTFVTYHTPFDTDVHQALSLLKPLFGEEAVGLPLPDEATKTLFFAITGRVSSSQEKPLLDLSSVDRENMSSFAQTLFDTLVLKNRIREKLSSTHSAPLIKKKM